MSKDQDQMILLSANLSMDPPTKREVLSLISHPTYPKPTRVRRWRFSSPKQKSPNRKKNAITEKIFADTLPKKLSDNIWDRATNN